MNAEKVVEAASEGDDLRIDNLRFAREGQRLERSFPLSRFERLAGLVLSRDGEVALDLNGFVQGEGVRSAAFLRLKAHASLVIACTRCLEPIVYPVEIDSLFELVRSEDDIDQDAMEDDSRDHLVFDFAMSVPDLLEDELMLALPVAARHDDCSLPGDRVAGQESSPFGVLAGMKKSTH